MFKKLCRLLFSYKGRVNRKSYLLGIVLNALFIALDVYAGISLKASTSEILFVVCALLLAPPVCSIFVLLEERLNDIGKSSKQGGGWWLLLTILMAKFPWIALIMGIMFIVTAVVISFWPSDKNSNKYGTPYTTLFPPDPTPPEAVKPGA